MLVVLVLGSLVYGGFYFGMKSKITSKPESVMTENTTIPEIVVTSEPIALPAQAGNDQKLLTVSGGVARTAGLSFDLYSVTTPDTWVSAKSNQTAMDEKLTLTKDGYEITIFQAATGGALCLYPGDPDFEGPSSKYTVFTNLTTKDGRTLRRSGEQNGLAFTVCQKSPDGSYQQPTNYGHISIKIPANYTPEVITEVDSIISSLKKI